MLRFRSLCTTGPWILALGLVIAAGDLRADSNRSNAVTGSSEGTSASTDRDLASRDRPGRDRPGRDRPGRDRPSDRPQQRTRSHFPPNYHLLRPMGSAANVRRGFYDQNMSAPQETSPDGHHRPGRHRHPAPGPPLVVIVAPGDPYQPTNDDAFAVGRTRGPEEASDPVTAPRAEFLEVDAATPARDAHRQLAEPRAALPPPARPAPRPAPLAPLDVVPPPAARPTEPQDVTLRVVPADATVWLDDEFLGPATELDPTVRLAPGVHILEVEHDTLPRQRLFFGVVDQPVEVSIDLAATRASRRTRVR
jgi:hypothetical protein